MENMGIQRDWGMNGPFHLGIQSVGRREVSDSKRKEHTENVKSILSVRTTECWGLQPWLWKMDLGD